MKEENPKVWWKEVKRLCGAKPSADNVTSHIHTKGIEDMSYEEPGPYIVGGQGAPARKTTFFFLT